MPSLSTAPSRRLVSFFCDAFRYAASTGENDSRRLIVAPYSGLKRSDACALVVAAGDRSTLLETIESERLSLPHDRRAARRFAAALEQLARSYRAQGVSARELAATVVLAFDLAARSSPRDAAALATVTAAAEELDAAAGAAWTIDAALADFEAAVEDTPAASTPPELQPLGARAPEQQRVVRRRRTHYSASALGTYAECERRWYYRYVCGAIEDKGSSATFYGSAFHWALERFHDEFKRGDAAPPDVLANKLDGWIQTAFEHYRSGFETKVEYELQTRRARRTGRRYLAWFLERARAHPFTIVGTESEVSLELDGYEFIGYIDRLDRDDVTGALTVVDYKTGSIATSAAEYREDVAAFVEFQLPFYYWAQTARGERVSRLALVPLKDALLDVEPIELEVVPVKVTSPNGNGTSGTIGIDELERARAKMIEIARRLADEPLEHFDVTRDPDICTFCAYRAACRRHPHRREDRFAQ